MILYKNGISNHINSYTKDDSNLMHFESVSVGAYRFLVVRPNGKRLLGRPRRYNQPGYSIGRHVFPSGILSVLSGGTAILSLVTMNITYIISRC